MPHLDFFIVDAQFNIRGSLRNSKLRLQVQVTINTKVLFFNQHGRVGWSMIIKYHCHLKVNAFSWHLALKAQPLLFRDAIGIMFASIIIKFSREGPLMHFVTLPMTSQVIGHLSDTWSLSDHDHFVMLQMTSQIKGHLSDSWSLFPINAVNKRLPSGKVLFKYK